MDGIFINIYSNGLGNDDGPPAPDAWKRAVLRAPPERFYVEMLPPGKKGGKYNFGMRICPIMDDTSSRASSRYEVEYEIWRRWEDCLVFQDTLELEYRRAARQKRQRLIRGKGVKKNGLYMQDKASSWESLPPGPDPKSVAKELHDSLPRLTKKGGLFRVSDAAVEQRQKELATLVGALMDSELPALVKDLLLQREITDFFGYWQRDQDLFDKARQKDGQKPHSSTSTRSVFSMYLSSSSSKSSTTTAESPHSSHFSSSTPGSTLHSSAHSRLSRMSISTAAPPKSIHHSGRSSMSSSTLSRSETPDTIKPLSTIQRPRSESDRTSPVESIGRRRADSTTSSESSSSAQSSTSSDSCARTSNPVVVDEVPLMFDHNPHHPQQDRPASILSMLPDVAPKPVLNKIDTILRPTRLRSDSSASIRGRHRQGCIFVPSPSTPMEQPLPNIQAAFEVPTIRTPIRESWQTTDTSTTFLEGLEIILPDDKRASLATIESCMTDCTTDPALPRTPRRSNVPQDISNDSASVFEDDEFWDPETNRIDPMYFDQFPIPNTMSLPSPADSIIGSTLSVSQLEPTPECVQSTIVTAGGNYLAPSFIPKVSTTTTFSTTAIGATGPRLNLPDIVTIKAAYGDAIILLKTSRDASFEDIKKKLYTKFVGQEGIPLSKSFKVAFIFPPPCSSESGISGDETILCIDEKISMQLVQGQDDWELFAHGVDGNKFSIKILD